MAYRYIILDSQNIPLARALLLSPVDAEVWELELLDEGLEAIMEHEVLQLVGIDERAPAKSGRLLRGKGDRIALEPLDTLSDDVRGNLRVHARCNTYIYPINTSWSGRVPVVMHDLSSGGVAFYSVRELARGDQVEIVMPITNYPIILKAQVIRPRPSNSKIQLYAAKFIDTSADEERMIREAVFNIQIKNQKI